MDSCDLLARENEFRKLNKQLEKKTENLMKEIECVLQKQDIFSDFSQNISLRLNPKENVKKHFCNPNKTVIPERPGSCKKINHTVPSRTKNVPNFTSNRTDNATKTLNEDYDERKQNTPEASTVNNSKVVCDCCITSNRLDLEFLYAFVSVSVKEKILPEFFLKDVSLESICKCLSSKIKLLQEQNDKLQAAIKKKELQCEQHLTKLADYEEERMTLLNKSNNLNASATEIRTKYAALQHRFEEKERLYKEQRSECDKLSNELAKLKARNVKVEAKCASNQQAIDSLTMQVQIAKRQEKEMKESTRAMSTAHQTTISNLESRVKRLTARIDKQSALIDNLKRQNALLCTDGALKALEKEYNAFLNQDF